LKPYYQDKWVTIYHGDCREILPQLDVKVDLVLTDPPYGHNIDYLSYEDSLENLKALIDSVMPRLFELSALIALTPGNDRMFYYPKPSWVLCWYIGPNGTGSTPWGFNCWQPILVYGKDPYLAEGLGRRKDIIIHEFENQFHASHFIKHPTVKPEKTWSKLIMRLSPFNKQLILDPFLGSGTTCYCAKKLNRYSIGIEIEEKYCEIAAKRCLQEVMELV